MDGEFREDLFHRLSVLEMSLPSLRERVDDIEVLSRDIIAGLNVRCRSSITGVTSELQEQLQNYDWPGNVRELRNVLERAVLLAQGPVEASRVSRRLLSVRRSYNEQRKEQVFT